MKINVALGVLILAGFGIGTSLLTTSLFGQNPRKKVASSRNPMQVISSPARSTERPHTLQQGVPLIASLPDQHTVQSVVWGNVSIKNTPEGNVSINTSVDIYETRPNMSYRFYLRVYDLSMKTKFVDRPYDDQIFSPTLGEISRPSFTERLNLNPGRYVVEVRLHAFPDGFDVSKLGDDIIAKGYSSGSRKSVITIVD